MYLFRTLLTLGTLFMGVAAIGLAGCQKEANPAVPIVTPTGPPKDTTVFTNPLLPSGPDPWVIEKDGWYYMMRTTNTDLRIIKTRKMSELGSAPERIVYTPPANGNSSANLWAPELHYLNGKWYIYFTAGNIPGDFGLQRSWVLENSNDDPTTGTWTGLTRLFSSGEDFWSIDGSILEQKGQLYFIWSGHNGIDAVQRIYISKMANPKQLTGLRTELSHPQFSWELQGPPYVNEGPEILQHAGKTFLVYSASFCGTDFYNLGMLTASDTANPLDTASWVKSTQPVFGPNFANRAYATGHNGFFKSKDGTENWIIYHANSNPNEGCVEKRNPRMQRFGWKADGFPDFGTAAPISTPLKRPSGE